MTESIASQIVLAARPHGHSQASDFRLEERAVPTPDAPQHLQPQQERSRVPVDRWARSSSQCVLGKHDAQTYIP